MPRAAIGGDVMIAKILVVAGLITGALGLLDLFLKDTQRRVIQNWTLRAWDGLHPVPKTPS
jgi:hypothetical protein